MEAEVWNAANSTGEKEVQAIALNQTPGSLETQHIVAQTNKDFLLSDTQSVDLENYDLSK